MPSHEAANRTAALSVVFNVAGNVCRPVARGCEALFYAAVCSSQ